ncbi:MAG: azurin [Pseudomonadota bacterium]
MKQLIVGLALMFAAGMANAACEVNVEVGDSLAFSESSITVEASCETVTVNLKHTGSLPAAAMGHNWVLSKTAEYQAVANDGMAAGLDANYLPADDARVLVYTKIIGGGEETSVSFSLSDLDAGESYTFYCSFPGHTGLMNGTFTIS